MTAANAAADESASRHEDLLIHRSIAGKIGAAWQPHLGSRISRSGRAAAHIGQTLFRRRLPAAARPTRPIAINDIVAGSGTVSVGVPATTSIPTALTA